MRKKSVGAQPGNKNARRALPGERRDQRLALTLTKQEKATVIRVAKKMGLSVPDLLVKAVKQYKQNVKKALKT